MKNLRDTIEDILEDSKVYGGIGDGDGEYCNVEIDEEKLKDKIEALIKPFIEALEEIKKPGMQQQKIILDKNGHVQSYRQYIAIKALMELEE